MSAAAGTPPSPFRSAVAQGLVGKGAELLALGLIAVVLPRALGPGDYGRWVLAFSVVTLASTAVALGGPTLMSRFVPSVEPERRPALARALVRRLAPWRALAVLCFCAAAAAASALAPDSFPALETGLVALALALDTSAALVNQTALGLGHTLAYASRYGLQYCVVAIATVVLHELAGTAGAVAGIAVGSAAGLALGVGTIGRELAGAERGAELPAGALRFGVLQVAGGLFQHLRNRGGVIAVAILAGSAAQTGYAGMAIGAALAGMYAVAQCFSVTLPERAEQATADAQAAERTARRLAHTLLVVTAPLALVSALFLDDLVTLVFGQEFAAARDAFVPALAALPLAPVLYLCAQVLALRLEAGKFVATTIAGAVTGLAVATGLAPSLEGAAGSAGLLAGCAATVVVSVPLLPGLRVLAPAAASLVLAAAVLAIALAT